MLLVACVAGISCFGLRPGPAWAQAKPGQLVIIGGGTIPPVILQRIIALAGGANAPIVIFPQASEIPDEAAKNTVSLFQAAGARQVEVFGCKAPQVDTPACLAQIDKAGGLFFTGGDQNRLAAAFKNTQAFARIVARHNQGHVLAGTSAGAAIMSKIMLTGEMRNPAPAAVPATDDPAVDPFKTIQKGNVLTAAGFGFVTRYIVDQHFIKRQRENRLLSVVLDHPELIGVGIDESTAIVVRPNQAFEVIGVGSVLVIDARKATGRASDVRQNYTARNLILHLLTPGQTFD